MLQIPPQKLKELLVKQDLIAPQLFDDLVLEAERMKQKIGRAHV